MGKAVGPCPTLPGYISLLVERGCMFFRVNNRLQLPALQNKLQISKKTDRWALFVGGSVGEFWVDENLRGGGYLTTVRYYCRQ